MKQCSLFASLQLAHSSIRVRSLTIVLPVLRSIELLLNGTSPQIEKLFCTVRAHSYDSTPIVAWAVCKHCISITTHAWRAYMTARYVACTQSQRVHS